MPAPAPPPLAFEIQPLSKKELDYPALRAMHEASSLESAEEVKGWRAAAGGAEGGEKAKGESENRRFSLQSLGDAEIPRDTIEEVIMRRGSTTRATRDAVG